MPAPDYRRNCEALASAVLECFTPTLCSRIAGEGTRLERMHGSLRHGAMGFVVRTDTADFVTAVRISPHDFEGEPEEVAKAVTDEIRKALEHHRDELRSAA